MKISWWMRKVSLIFCFEASHKNWESIFFWYFCWHILSCLWSTDKNKKCANLCKISFSKTCDTNLLSIYMWTIEPGVKNQIWWICYQMLQLYANNNIFFGAIKLFVHINFKIEYSLLYLLPCSRRRLFLYAKCDVFFLFENKMRKLMNRRTLILGDF